MDESAPEEGKIEEGIAKRRKARGGMLRVLRQEKKKIR